METEKLIERLKVFHSSFDFSGICTFPNRELLVFFAQITPTGKLPLINSVLTAMILRCLLPFLNFRFFFVSSVL